MAKAQTKPNDENPVEQPSPKEPQKPKLLPLTDEESVELADLETRARKGRQLLQPTAIEMRRLGQLRQRAKA